MKLKTPQHTQEARQAAEALGAGGVAVVTAATVAMDLSGPVAAVGPIASELAPMFLGLSCPGASPASVRNYSRELDLGNFEAALAWADENGVYFFDDNTDPSDPYALVLEEARKELISDYCAKFREVMKHETVRIYRDVMLARVEDFDPTAAGLYWSFEELCTSTAGAMHLDSRKRFTVVGDLRTADINWEEGLKNFINYPEQWECNVKMGAPISILSVLPRARPTAPPDGGPKHWLGF